MNALAATTVYSIAMAAMVCGGIAGIFAVVGVVVLTAIREQNGRPLIPWGARMRVERAKANLEYDAIEVKRLAVEHQRSRVLTAIDAGDSDTVQLLGLPTGNGKVEAGSWR